MSYDPAEDARRIVARSRGIELPETNPRECYLYRLYTRGGELLYVGVSVHPERRISEHRRDKAWAHLIDRESVRKYPSERAAQRAEEEAIKGERPRFNVIHNNEAPPSWINLPQELALIRGEMSWALGKEDPSGDPPRFVAVGGNLYRAMSSGALCEVSAQDVAEYLNDLRRRVDAVSSWAERASRKMASEWGNASRRTESAEAA
jgi:predicted GIY-YIG superfamily endonuclease